MQKIKSVEGRGTITDTHTIKQKRMDANAGFFLIDKALSVTSSGQIRLQQRKSRLMEFRRDEKIDPKKLLKDNSVLKSCLTYT